MNVVFDTNRYRDFCEGDPHTVTICRRSERIALPYVVLAELRAGFRCGTKVSENEQVLVRFLNKPRVEVLYPDESTKNLQDTHISKWKLDSSLVLRYF